MFAVIQLMFAVDLSNRQIVVHIMPDKNKYYYYRLSTCTNVVFLQPKLLYSSTMNNATK